MKTILVIEDDHLLREQLLEWLDLEGFEGISAEDGLSGVEAALTHHPDLIICDVMLPEMSGFGVIAQLRQEPSTATIPLIFLTALATDRDRRQGSELGAVDYITKPFRFSDILRVVQSQLGLPPYANNES